MELPGSKKRRLVEKYGVFIKRNRRKNCSVQLKKYKGNDFWSRFNTVKGRRSRGGGGWVGATSITGRSEKERFKKSQLGSIISRCSRK